MLELGKYAGPILWSWAITLLLMAAIAALSWVQAGAAKRKHDEIEARRAAGKGAR